MASFGQVLSLEGITQVDTDKRFALGKRIQHGDKTYIYVQGVTSGAAGKHAHYTNAGVTTLTTANGKGPLGIFMATLSATTMYGFLQIQGINATADVTALTAGAQAYLTATGGRLDETDVAGDAVVGYTGVVTGSANVATVMLNFPYTTDVAID